MFEFFGNRDYTRREPSRGLNLQEVLSLRILNFELLVRVRGWTPVMQESRCSTVPSAGNLSGDPLPFLRHRRVLSLGVSWNVSHFPLKNSALPLLTPYSLPSVTMASRLSSFRAPYIRSEVSPIPAMHLHLESTLRLVTAMSPEMTINDLLMVKICLSEAEIVVTQLIAQRERTAAVGKATSSLSLHSLTVDDREY